jgi:dTDP-4-dehydrorhamnose reductase
MNNSRISRIQKIYIAGCGGMLGDAFYRQFNNNYELKCTDIDVNENWLSYLDFRSFTDYRDDVIKFQPEYLFHLGAFTDLEYCELHPKETYQTNTKSVEHGVKIANELNIPILFISTAGIFNGKKNIYDENDTPDPMGHYAKSKYLGELFVQENARKYLICRAGWMMGGGPRKDKKFIQKLITQIANGEDELFIVNDKLGTPTYTHDFAKNVKVLIEDGKTGLYNMVCQGHTSRLEIAFEIIRQLGLDDRIKINEVSSKYFQKEYFAPRPVSEKLINARLHKEGLDVMRGWKTSLSEYISEDYPNYIN